MYIVKNLYGPQRSFENVCEVKKNLNTYIFSGKMYIAQLKIIFITLKTGRQKSLGLKGIRIGSE